MIYEKKDNFSNYISFLKLKTHKYIISDDLWYDVRPFIFQPVRILSPISNDLLKFYGVKNKVFALRWFELNQKTTSPIYWWVASGPYNFSSLSKKARNQTRRGLENFRIEKTKPERNHEPIFKEIYFENLDRLNLIKSNKKKEKLWAAWWQIILNFDGSHIWSAWYENELAAYLVVIYFGEMAEIVLHRSKSNLLPYYPNNALLFTVVIDLIAYGYTCISYGLENYWPQKGKNLSHFKENMGFTKIILDEHYYINPKISWLINESKFKKILKIIRNLKK
jgi:hypothetical protein